MGVTYVRLNVKNPQHPSKTLEREFLVDSGATYSVVPKKELKELGIKPHRKQEFTLADGTKVRREIGDAIFEYEGIRGAAPIVFGEKGDSTLLGVFTLEALGLILDPFQRKIKPMKLMMV
ncbi:aspartyl protease family protein [Candidatus Roizmanbacteria bacterium]|nr:aspartyl protease family protein [Candidatus Roizmanbacteria bacterium]